MKNYTLILTFLISFVAFAQVGVNIEEPNAKTVLHISEQRKATAPIESKGILIPRLTEAQRNSIKPGVTENGLLVYNTEENCYNYWNTEELDWKSLCGKLGKSQFTFDCSQIEVKGIYVEDRELSSSNYLRIPVTVTKPGEYTLVATTSNGYSFFTTNSFLNTGNYTIQVAGQGTPIAVQTDDLTINVDRVDVPCAPAVQVTVIPASGTYSMNCGSATVNGVYTAGIPLTTANTITLPVVVTTLGGYTVSTNTVDGFSFSGSGRFTSIGAQNITLYGTGTPNSVTTKTVTLVSDSQGGVVTSCEVKIVIVIPKKKFLLLGAAFQDSGQLADLNSNAGKMLSSPNNFGSNVDSTVKLEGFDFQTIIGTTTLIKNQMIDAIKAKPDMIFIGHKMSWGLTKTDPFVQAVIEYLRNRGVLFMADEDTSVSTFFRELYANLDINTPGQNSYINILPNISDPILNGPFGDLRGKSWGAKESLRYISGTGVPAHAVVYAPSTATPGLIMFRDPTLNFIYCGDGDFLESQTNCIGPTCGTGTVQPFTIDADYRPITKTNWIGNTPAENSRLFANIVAWMVNQAEFNGINKN